MGKKSFVIALAVFAFGFGSALRSNAGTDMVEPYRAPAPTYNYAPPPPRPVVYVPPVRFGVVVGPAFGGISVRDLATTVATGFTAAMHTGAVVTIAGTNQRLCRGGCISRRIRESDAASLRDPRAPLPF